MLNLIKTTGKLLVNTVALIAFIGVVVFVYIMVLISEVGPNKPKLVIH